MRRWPPTVIQSTYKGNLRPYLKQIHSNVGMIYPSRNDQRSNPEYSNTSSSCQQPRIFCWEFQSRICSSLRSGM